MASNSTAISFTIEGRGEARDKHNRELALHHANLLQQRKDTEALNLIAIEELLEFPSARQVTSYVPDSQDVQRFQELIKFFQISDYKDLIEERNIAGKCGYIFCPHPSKRSRTSGGGDFLRIVRGKNLEHRYSKSGVQELTVIPNSKFDLWCDEWCARQALYIQMQLSETPAWERGSAENIKITLPGGRSYGALAEVMPEKMKCAEKDKYRQSTENLRQSMADLALERGERSVNYRIFPTHVFHRDTSQAAASPPHLEQNEGGGIEGYTPRITTSNTNSADRVDEESRDMDWELG